MSPVVSRQLVEVVDTRSTTRTLPTAVDVPLDRCTVAPWGLQITTITPEDPFVLAETSWLLPAHGVRLRRRRSRDASDVETTAIGAVRIEVDGHVWRVTDLVLGLDVVPGRPARVAHHADFAAGVAGGVLTSADADEAMAVVHRVLGELVDHRHDLVAWAEALGVSSLVAS